jgi:outer membrane protein
MKNISLALNVILLLAVGVLFYLHFSGSNNKSDSKKRNTTSVVKNTVAPGSGTTIAYVDLDTLNEKIFYIKNTRKSLESEQLAIETEWENAYRNMENEKNKFLSRGKAITQEEAEQFQGSLMQKQQMVDGMKQSKTQKLNEKSYKFLEGIQEKLKNFLAEYNEDAKYTYIFSTGNGLDYMLYKDSSFNITNDVVLGMNELLESESKKK